MYTLELLWPIDSNGHNEFAVIAKSADYDELFAIAHDTDFRAWAGCEGCAFIEIWAPSDNIVYMQRV